MGGDWVDYDEVYPCLISQSSDKSIPDKEELVNATRKVVYCFEKEFGAFGEIGMDIAVDIYGNMWFIEANTKPEKISKPSLYDPKEIPVEAINVFDYAMFLTGVR
jgi:D-alanine-D-alanine ligase-like ATP-grasp enzyme